ncbi:hypothetical protein B0H16DRAFT_767831 [Mycena metata]|uniref:Uncharacterized protein n=1 Tax=Mycena metata TaxID=1033252 RepID=A0AAD7J088_9AGAR|nr:hypothetical protein B0H16DRAFT_767831 [Mycena metata]
MAFRSWMSTLTAIVLRSRPLQRIQFNLSVIYVGPSFYRSGWKEITPGQAVNALRCKHSYQNVAQPLREQLDGNFLVIREQMLLRRSSRRPSDPPTNAPALHLPPSLTALSFLWWDLSSVVRYHATWPLTPPRPGDLADGGQWT